VARTFFTNQKHRDSLVYDVMEAGMSDVDSWLLDFIKTYMFSRKIIMKSLEMVSD
jgi:hypothetical protein